METHHAFTGSIACDPTQHQSQKFAPVCSRNGSLQPYDNTSLESMKLRNAERHAGENYSAEQRLIEKIDYYLCLNAFGRGRIQTSQMTLSELVDILRKISAPPDQVDSADHTYNFVRLNDHNKLKTLYGILRENPSLWAK
jgi:hypothetical protein